MSLLLLLLFSSSYWGYSLYQLKTEKKPDYGGEYIEGSIGQPKHINPILSSSTDIDSDLTKLIYSGLMKYDGNGNIVPDLAESYSLNEEKNLYTFYLKKNVTWHDGTPLSADDVLFTFNLITNPLYKSPLRPNWQGVTIDKLDDHTVLFSTKNPYAGFINNATFAIAPKHLWESVSPENFNLVELNLEPIGTGPYKYDYYHKDSKGNILTYKLTANPTYFEGKPYISKLTFNFYIDENAAMDAYNRKEIMGIGGLYPQKINDIKNQKSSQTHIFSIPRYSAVFLNQNKSFPLAEDKVREALNYATNREEIIAAALGGQGSPVYSPILPGSIGYSEELGRINYDPEKAKELLESSGWKTSDDGFRAKGDKKLEINLVTTDWEEFSKSAEILKAQWEKVGAKLNITTPSIADIQQNYIRPREYEALLFAQDTGAASDLSSFWHSGQIMDPGRNLSLFGDEETDKLIQDGRMEFDPEKRKEIYIEFQKKLLAENPVIFLCQAKYLYPINKKVNGIAINNLVAPSHRFFDVHKWYVKTRRAWK